MSKFLKLEPVRVQSAKLWLLKKLISLPRAVLRACSGTVALHTKGRTLDAQMQFLGQTFFAPSGRPLLRTASRTIEQARLEWSQMVELMGIPSGLQVSLSQVHGDMVSSGFGGLSPISGLLIKPAYIDPMAPLLVFFHQGGGIIGGPEVSKAAAALIAHHAKCPVLLPEYRLAPSCRFPAALEDAHAVVEWAFGQGRQLGAKSDQIALGGILTGANLALRVCLDRRRDFKPLPRHLTLITPLLDLSDATLKASPYAASWPISGADLETMIAHYAGAETDLASAQISPLKEKILNGLPQTLVVAAGFDPLAAQIETFNSRLLEAGVRIDYRQYETLPLGFDLFCGLVDEARNAMIEIAQCLKSAYF